MERGPAEEALAAGSARAGRARAPECVRRQRRRELDARRGKCRIRIGGHLERWCRLKEQLGFALHSQLAEFLLDRYGSPGCTWGPGDSAPEGLRPAALQRLVALSHGHGQECGFVPDVLLPAPGVAAPLVWECVAGHRFSWGGSGRPDGPSRDPPGAARGRGPAAGAGRRRSLRGTAPGSAGAGAEGAAGSPRGAGGRGGEPGDGGAGGGAAPRAPPEPGPAAGESAAPGTDGGPRVVPRGEEEGAGFDGGAGPACAEDLHDGDYRPSPDSCRRRPRAGDVEAARIGPKRIRKAAKREILLCDFEGCGRIFSNRQYLNHHRKYQHVHQRTFTCSEPTCGRSFNFKKHLKEHEKLHSDRRDYICEFCARSFRTSSNLIIHRRIHTGEKPLQCEICGFTCRQKASLNWHMRKHDADSSYRFPCDVCGRRFEKRDNVAAHKSKSHPGELGGPPGPEALGRRPEPPGPAGPPEPLGGVPEGGGDAGGAPLGCGAGDVGRDPGAPRGRVAGEGGS